MNQKFITNLNKAIFITSMNWPTHRVPTVCPYNYFTYMKALFTVKQHTHTHTKGVITTQTNNAKAGPARNEFLPMIHRSSFRRFENSLKFLEIPSEQRLVLLNSLLCFFLKITRYIFFGNQICSFMTEQYIRGVHWGCGAARHPPEWHRNYDRRARHTLPSLGSSFEGHLAKACPSRDKSFSHGRTVRWGRFNISAVKLLTNMMGYGSLPRPCLGHSSILFWEWAKLAGY